MKGLTLSPNLALVNLEGTGLIGVPGTAERVFAALRNAKVSVVMISQGSSEHSICCVVRGSEAAKGQAALLDARSFGVQRSGTVRVATSQTISAHLMPQCIAAGEREYPEIRIMLRDQAQHLGADRARAEHGPAQGGEHEEERPSQEPGGAEDPGDQPGPEVSP